MINLIETIKLKEHHKNGYYFTDIEGEKYEEVKRSIEAQGIRDPIKCTRDYTVISGHQRLRIARDLGMEKVPYQMLDVDEEKAEYLLIAENWERRGKAETDPIKVSRILKFLEEYWKKKGEYVEGRGNAHNAQLKSESDLAEFIGETRRTTQRLMKLHDLIPQLQRLVSAGKLGTTAGEQLAHLTPEVQTALYDALGEEIADKTVAETKQLRKDVDGKTSEEVVEMIKKENERLKEEIREKDAELLRAKTPKVEVKEVIKEVVPAEVQREYDEMKSEKRQLEQSLMRTYERIEQLEKIEKTVRTQEESPMYDLIRSLQTANRYFDTFTLNEKFTAKAIASAEQTTVDSLETQLRRTLAKANQVMALIDERNGVIVIDETTKMEVIVNE